MKEAVNLQIVCLEAMEDIAAKQQTKSDFCMCSVGEIINNMRKKKMFSHQEWQENSEMLNPSREFTAKCAIDSLRLNEAE